MLSNQQRRDIRRARIAENYPDPLKITDNENVLIKTVKAERDHKSNLYWYQIVFDKPRDGENYTIR